MCGRIYFNSPAIKGAMSKRKEVIGALQSTSCGLAAIEPAGCAHRRLSSMEHKGREVGLDQVDAGPHSARKRVARQVFVRAGDHRATEFTARMRVWRLGPGDGPIEPRQASSRLARRSAGLCGLYRLPDRSLSHRSRTASNREIDSLCTRNTVNELAISKNLRP